jgi:hypothetical protein
VVKRLILLALLCGAAIEAIAAPPPPPAPRDDLPQTMDGYDIGSFYSRYSYWLERQKGQVIDTLMAEVPEMQGYRAFAPIVSYKKFEDYGHYQSGEIRSYCRVIDEWRTDNSDCLFVLRKINVPVAAIAEDSPLGEFMRQSFDPAKLVAGLKANGIAPDADIWRIDGATVFGVLPSPVAVLTANARTERIDSKQCPAMLEELKRLERTNLSYPVDMIAVGDDGPIEAPAPHSVMREDVLRFATATGIVTVTGNQRSVYGVLEPLYAAVDACADQAAKAPSSG